MEDILGLLRVGERPPDDDLCEPKLRPKPPNLFPLMPSMARNTTKSNREQVLNLMMSRSVSQCRGIRETDLARTRE